MWGAMLRGENELTRTEIYQVSDRYQWKLFSAAKDCGLEDALARFWRISVNSERPRLPPSISRRKPGSASRHKRWLFLALSKREAEGKPIGSQGFRGQRDRGRGSLRPERFRDHCRLACPRQLSEPARSCGAAFGPPILFGNDSGARLVE
jgi:hypothetical protein